MRRRFTAFLLILAILISIFPVMDSAPENANAGTIYIEGLGNVELKFQRKNGYSIYLDEDKNLIVKGTYYTDSSATLSYHTSRLYFATRSSGKNIGNLSVDEWFSVNVEHHKTVISGNNSYDTYNVSRIRLETMIEALFGRDGLKTEQTVYISEGFRLKKRDSENDEWGVPYGEVYNSLAGIRGAANWSSTTYQNFENYYDIQITLELVKYNVTVESDEGGTVGQSSAEAYAGDDVTINAYPDDDYNFTGWTVVSGNIGSFDTTSATTTFTMPTGDVVIKANFQEKNKPPATRPPVATPDLTKPTPTVAPTPTPEPTPTPPYMPTESTEEIQKSVRYYSTDAGYSIGGIYNRTVTPRDDAFGYICGGNFDNKIELFENNTYTNKGDYSYKVGTDSTGNAWYFIPDGTKATFVHPKVYKGYVVDSADVRYITELTFPETLTYGGNSYTVTSIGGGTDKYCEIDSVQDGSVVFGEWSPCYNSYEQYVNEVYTGEGLRQYTNTIGKGRKLGVIGNGSIWSSDFLYLFYSNSTNEHFEFENSYYVYNTTLQYVTIPSTVTKIEDFAFSGCQALVKIIGGDNVTDIGDNAFAAIGLQTLEKSYVKYRSEGHVQKFEYYYYNGSFTFGAWTEIMQAWKNNVVLSDYMELPVFSSLKYIGVSAFEKRKNLFDVTLPTGMSEIGANAFKGCALDRITVPSKTTKIGDRVRPSRTDRTNTTPEYTLGTKGKNETNKTLIVTELNSKVMDYGVLYEDYYDVRAGYNIVYHNNYMPAETYITKPRIVKNYATLKERLPLVGMAYGFGNAAFPSERYYSKEVLLDTDGGLYIAEGYNMPERQLAEYTFSNVYTFCLVNGNKSTDSMGFITGNYTDNYCCLAFADNGKVFLYQTNTDMWVDLGVSALVGNSNFAFHKNTFGSGGQSGSQSEETLNLYYINQNGGISSKTIYTRKESTSNYTGGSSNASYSYTLYDTAASSVSLPSGVSAVQRFCLSNESTNDPGYPPEINMEDTDGKFWKSSFGNWSSVSRYANTPVGYMEYQEEQEIYADRAITDFGPRLVGYNQIEKIYDLMFDPLGREFLGWTLRADGSGVLYRPGQELKITGTTNLYAKWAGDPSKKIEYIPNGGVGTMEDDIYPVDEPNPVTLQKNAFTRRGYEFVGWSYKAEPGVSDKIYGDEEQIVISAGTTRLYAQWKPLTYTVKVGTEDMRVVNQNFTEHILGLDEELTLGTKEDKILTISYDLNDKETQPSMHVKAEFVEELTRQNTEASLDFYGWRLYEDVNKDGKITANDKYVGYYGENTVLKNLASEKGTVFYAFPYWGGGASYVQLPEVLCDGYMFMGYTPGNAYKPDYFETSEAYEMAIRENILVPAPIGSGARYQPKADGEVLYAYYVREKSTGQLYGFEVYDVFGTPAWEEIRGTEYEYMIGVEDETSDIWSTLPLRTGVHPLYRNQGGLPVGGGFSFRVVSTGDFAGEDITLTITPHLCPVGEDGYSEADLYFEKETDRGGFLKKWSDEEQTMILYADKDSMITEDGFSWVWSGTFQLPESLWVAESGTTVSEYQQQFGLNFEESFWIKDARLMLRFALCLENGDGERLYYGMLQEESEENPWVEEAGEPYREDYDKNRYKLYGGEVAVIYPGDSVERWNQIHGIY